MNSSAESGLTCKRRHDKLAMPTKGRTWCQIQQSPLSAQDTFQDPQ